MTTLDWLIAAVTLLFAVNGYARGFIVGALSLVAFVVGAIVGTRVADALLSSGAASPYAPLFGLLGALTAGAILAIGMDRVASRLRRVVRIPLLGLVDGLAGAALGSAVALAMAWVLGVIVVSLPGTTSLRGDVERSLILRNLDELLPPSGVVLNALTRIDPLPGIGAPLAPIAAPPRLVAQGGPAVVRASRSVVRVIGEACGLGIEGSGWVVAPDEVLTNAHVVAGETDTLVEVAGAQPARHATAILFDPRNDLAILRVRGLTLPALMLASAAPAGTAGVILGYPLDGPFDAQAGRIGETRSVSTDDAYGRGPVVRLLTAVRGLIRPGNSGGPVLGASGEVLTTVFAATTGGGPHGGYGVANATVEADLARARGPVSTEGCTS
jgi:S1-C subfamily serine protease